MKAIRDELSTYSEAQDALVKKHANGEDVDGNPRIERNGDGNYEAYVKDWNQLVDEEVSINAEPIHIDALRNPETGRPIAISAATIGALDFMLITSDGPVVPVVEAEVAE